ncbi:MAG: hypothetical protein WBA73_11760, partial [Devosia sp.]
MRSYIFIVVCRWAGFGHRVRHLSARGMRGSQKGVRYMAQTNLPVLSAEGGLSRYLQEIRKFP